MKDLIAYLGNSTTDERYQKLIGLLQECGADFYTQMNDPFNAFFAVKNIIIPAREQVNKIVLCAHYDVVYGSSGYLDNTSAIVLVLSILPDLLKHDNVEIIFSDREEQGGTGASHYCNMSKTVPRLVVNLDIIGHGEVLYYCRYNVHSTILEKLNEKCIEQNYPFCDFNIFRMNQFPCVSIISAPSGPFQAALTADYTCMHRGKFDGDMDKIDINTLERTQIVLLELLEFMNS